MTYKVRWAPVGLAVFMYSVLGSGALYFAWARPETIVTLNDETAAFVVGVAGVVACLHEIAKMGLLAVRGRVVVRTVGDQLSVWGGGWRPKLLGPEDIRRVSSADGWVTVRVRDGKPVRLRAIGYAMDGVEREDLPSRLEGDIEAFRLGLI